LVARANAQVVAPAKGRVVFAGPYRGFGQIVIIEHTRGWTSLVTGMSAALVEVGDDLVAGSPLGRAIGANPSGGAMPLTLELRRAGKPVNPLEFLSR
jgi:septal ring factor EnvC (AmiA/AmiB activator)